MKEIFELLLGLGLWAVVSLGPTFFLIMLMACAVEGAKKAWKD